MAEHDEHEDRLLEHDYDGIKEYDNPMPRWWVWTFYATIIFVPLYYILPHPFGAGEGNVAEYEASVAKAEASAPAPVVATVTDEELRTLAGQSGLVAEGKAVYDLNCAACHRADGGGMIGPNLTDAAWIHGGTPVDIHRVIREGVLAKGMPPWERLLRPEQVNAVTAYVISLKGTNPPNPKAPEGVVPTDS